MQDEPRVWLRKRKLKARGGRERYAFDLRYYCPDTHKMKSRKVRDPKRVQGERLQLEKELSAGTHRDITNISWDAFVSDHVSKISGKRNAEEASRTLREFGEMMKPRGPRYVTFSMVEGYVAKMDGIATATVNKKLRYLRAAMNRAILRDYATNNPVAVLQGQTKSPLFQTEERKVVRVLTDAEEAAILDACKTLYGTRMWSLVYAALRTGGRRGELLALDWNHVHLDDEPRVHFTNTKSHQDRMVPLNADVVDVMRRLQPMTLREGGPFMGMSDNISRQWGRVRRHAGVEDVSIHDMRRTYVTRLIRANVPLPTVQKLAGHSNVTTTMKYYTQVNDQDLREGQAKLIG